MPGTGYSVQDILSYVPLTEAVETVKSGIPKVLPETFWTTTEQVSGDRVRLVEYAGTRQVARLVPYGAPPLQTGHLPISDRSVIMLHSAEEMAYEQELLTILRNWEDYAPQQMFAMKEISRQGEQFRRRQENLEVAAVQLNLANAGLVWFDANGNLLPTSSGAVLTVDQKVPSANTGTINGLLTGSFADPTFDIVTFINKLKQAAVQATGYPLLYAFYGANISGYFAANNYTKLMWNFNQALNAEYWRTGRVPREMLELIWIPVQEAFYVDASGNIQVTFPADQIVFTPEINRETYAFYTGSQLVPTQFGPVASGEAALKSFTEVFGRARFAYIDPKTGIISEQGRNTFFPRFKVPGAYYFLNSTAG